MTAWADKDSHEWLAIQQIEGLMAEAVALAQAAGLDTISLASVISEVLYQTQGETKGDL
jgi:hypothetical protein